MFKDARLKSGLTIEEAAARNYIGPRTLSNYEAGMTIPGPDVALQMSKVYKDPWLTQRYCKECCAIGQAYSYEILDHVNLDPASVMLKLVGEMNEAQAVLNEMLGLAVNKNEREDFSEEEWQEFIKCLHEFLDVEHNVEILKISLNKWCDMSELIQEHNHKCYERGYAKCERGEEVARSI
ncbi:helix-turn-helix domain-containing protein [Sporanaerobacter acetigenes]|uniref:helix-turn-helix domain-containing protein n=1 Tax=Sporanaerobacter acetigenes TaxID=165813 RepID=UPI00332F4389